MPCRWKRGRSLCQGAASYRSDTDVASCPSAWARCKGGALVDPSLFTTQVRRLAILVRRDASCATTLGAADEGHAAARAPGFTVTTFQSQHGQ